MIEIICAIINCILGMWIWFRLGKQAVIERLSKDLLGAGKLLAYEDMLIEQLKKENEHLKKVIDENADKSN
jgi:hypothetical protein